MRPALLGSLLASPVLLVASVGVNWTSGSVGPAELGIFGPPGRALLRGDLGAVYEDPINQGGPLELLPHGVYAWLQPSGLVGWTAVYLVGFLLLTSLLSLLALGGLLHGSSGRVQAYAHAATSVALVLGGVVPQAFDAGHIAQLIVPVLWLVAARAVTAERPALAGVLLGLSAGLEVWGVLGAPVVLVVLDRHTVQRTLRAGAAAVAVVVALYAPFLLTGQFRMFAFAWPVSSQSLVHRLDPMLTTFPWSLRLAQAAAVVLAASLVAWLARGSMHVCWLVPLAVLLVRLLLDPCRYGYYYAAPTTLLVAATAFCLARCQWGWSLLAGVGALWLRTEPSRSLSGTVCATTVVVLVALLVRLVGTWAGAEGTRGRRVRFARSVYGSAETARVAEA